MFPCGSNLSNDADEFCPNSFTRQCFAGFAVFVESALKGIGIASAIGFVDYGHKVSAALPILVVFGKIRVDAFGHLAEQAL